MVDYTYLGVTKMLIKLWFDSEHSKELWYCGQKVAEADSKLLQIKSPITRAPRSIQQHRNYWKGLECSAWLLYYSIPVMLSILPDVCLAHCRSYIHLLLQSACNDTESTKYCCSIIASKLNIFTQNIAKQLMYICF